MTYQLAQPAPLPENVNRGTVVALLTVPAGVIVWVIIWTIGIIASVVSFGIAILAMFLYRLGSGGQMGRAGAIRVTLITLVTVGLAIFSGLVWDVALAISRFSDVSPIEALSSPVFWDRFSNYMELAGGDLGFNILLSIGFGILGCFSILRGAFKTTAPVANPATGQLWSQTPITPGVDPATQQLWPQPPAPSQTPPMQTPPVEENPPR